MPQPDINSPHAPTPELSSDALRALSDEINRIPDANVVPIRVDVPHAVVTAVGVAKSLRDQRGALTATFGEGAGALVDRLEAVALAAGQAHAEHLAAGRVDLEPVHDELVETRNRLFTAASALVQRKALGKKALANLQGGTGYEDRCFDVLQLVSILESAWPAASGKTSLVRDDLDRAKAIANRFAKMVGERDHAAPAEKAMVRAKAFTLLHRTYEELRRKLAFVRWHEGDADAIAPSFHAGRKKPRTDAPSAPPSPIPVGLPGAEPFARP